MKTAFRALTTISAMSIVLLLASCSKDDPEPDVIVGKWNIISANATITVGSLSLVDYLISTGFTPADAEYAAELYETIYEGMTGWSFEFKNGGTVSSFRPGDEPSTGTWELSSDRKTLTLDKGTVNALVFTITTLTSSNLNMTLNMLEGEQATRIDFELTK